MFESGDASPHSKKSGAWHQKYVSLLTFTILYFKSLILNYYFCLQKRKEKRILKRGIERNSGYLFQLTSCLLLLFVSLLGLPNLTGADTVAPGGPPSLNQAAENRIGFDSQGNLGSIADDKYWKDIFKTDELTGQVRALVKDSAGNLYVGGSFYYAGGVAANGIAVWDGTQWSALGSGVDAQVSALTVVGPGNLFAGGQFALAGRKSSAFIGQWTKALVYLPLILK